MEKDGDILRRTLRHYIDLDYYANGVADDLTALFDELESEADGIIARTGFGTKDAYSLAYRMLKEKVDLFGNKVEGRLETEAESVKEKELEFLTALYGSVLAVGQVVTQKVLFAPVDSRDTVKTFAERTRRNILRSYDTAMRAGYMFAQPSGDIITQARRNLTQVSNGMRSGVMTAVPSFARHTDRIVFLRNRLEVVWCATLDGSTCLVCGSLHGKHFQSVSLAPPVPHNLCRCVLVPAASLSGDMPTYEEYIDSLPDEEQYHILGRNRYELHKRGLSLDKFVSNSHERLRLDQIDRSDLDAASFPQKNKKAL